VRPRKPVEKLDKTRWRHIARVDAPRPQLFGGLALLRAFARALPQGDNLCDCERRHRQRIY
jgi:hypothetical protein